MGQGKTINAMAWVDLETTGIPEPNPETLSMDFSRVHILEVAVLITDLDGDPLAGHHGVVRMTREAADVLKTNDYVRQMHTDNGLIRDSIKSEDAMTLEELDEEISKTFQEGTSFEPGEFIIAGSGVSRFDHPLIDIRMPKLARWLHYAEIDIGSLRRSSTMFNHGQPVVNPVPESSRDGVKTHRAWDDVQAHLKEGLRYRDFFRKAVPLVG